MEEKAFSFDDFSTEMEDFEVKQVSKHDRIWTISEGGSMCCIPLIRDGAVYFGSCNHNVYAVDAVTGKLVWKYRTKGIVFESSPAYWDGKIYSGSFDRFMYALDHTTGALVWKFGTRGPINSRPFVWEGKVYFGSKDQNVYCLDAKTGALVWKFGTRDEIACSPTVKDGRLFIGSYDHNFYCIDANTGLLIWKFPTQGEIHMQNDTLVHEGVVYLASFDNNLYALSERDGSLVWKFPTGSYGNHSSPVLHRDRLYHISRDGFLFALTLDGRLAWKFRRLHVPSIPTIHEDRIYVGFEDQRMYCLDLDGNELWKFPTQGSIWLKAVPWDGKLYFPCWDCNLYAVDIDSRRLAWKFRTEGSPSYLAPPDVSFELVIRKIDETVPEKAAEKRYEIAENETNDQVGGAYKSRVTYQMSSQYASRGKYQADDEGF